jgi:AraC-like DNA-binding protein
LPDGCVDVIWIGERPPIVAGPATRATTATIAAGVEVVGVRFRPGAAPHLLGVEARDLLDRSVPLRAIWPHDCAADWLDVMARPALADRLAVVSDFILDRLATDGEADPFVRRIVAWTVADPRVGLDVIARRCGMSERQVRRRFDRSIGYGPKTLQRILRLQRLLWLAGGAAAGHGLARLAIAAGYADQPHMTRETVALTGSTPRRLLLDTPPASAVSELFKTNGRDYATLTPLG